MSRTLDLDHRARIFNRGRTILGGDPPRVLRLTDTGAAAVREMLESPTADTAARQALAQRLIDAGIAHPRPEPAPVEHVTVVIPVRDRPLELDRCLIALGTNPARLDDAVESQDATAVAVIVVDDGSWDPDVVAAVCQRHGAGLLRREVAGGPAVARNSGLGQVDTELVAFLDSDCVPEPGWLALLCGALADPKVGAAAPRIRPVGHDQDHDHHAGRGALARFTHDRSPLDLGPHPATVTPGGRVSYVPSAALLVRRAALGEGFDPELRYGEDVDLVWRMHDQGWRIRYEPAATVGHAEPERLSTLLRRRFAYGTSAGPLALRHPARLAPLRLHPRPAVIIGLLLLRRPRATAAMAVAHVALTVRALRRVDVPPRAAAWMALTGVADSGAAVGRAMTMLLPGLLAVGLTRRRMAPAALALLLVEPARSWVRSERHLDPVRWCGLAVADDMAYGAGVWAGALRARTFAPLLPVLTRTAMSRGRVGSDRGAIEGWNVARDNHASQRPATASR